MNSKRPAANKLGEMRRASNVYSSYSSVIVCGWRCACAFEYMCFMQRYLTRIPFENLSNIVIPICDSRCCDDPHHSKEKCRV